LIEYGVAASAQSCNIKKRLESLGLEEGLEYQLIDIYEPVKQGGFSKKKVYMLTPEAFKKCLMRALAAFKMRYFRVNRKLLLSATCN